VGSDWGVGSAATDYEFQSALGEEMKANRSSTPNHNRSGCRRMPLTRVDGRGGSPSLSSRYRNEQPRRRRLHRRPRLPLESSRTASAVKADCHQPENQLSSPLRVLPTNTLQYRGGVASVTHADHLRRYKQKAGVAPIRPSPQREFIVVLETTATSMPSPSSASRRPTKTHSRMH